MGLAAAGFLAKQMARKTWLSQQQNRSRPAIPRQENVGDHVGVAMHVPAHTHRQPDRDVLAIPDRRDPVQLLFQPCPVVRAKATQLVHDVLNVSPGHSTLLAAQEDAFSRAPGVRSPPEI